jgi:hypothetical protein
LDKNEPPLGAWSATVPKLGRFEFGPKIFDCAGWKKDDEDEPNIGFVWPAADATGKDGA